MAGKKRKPEPLKHRPLIRTNDEVIVISGEGRSKTPRKVLSVLPREGKVVVEGVNIMKDSQKANRNAGSRQAGINEQGHIEKPYPIDISNVALYSPQAKAATRVRLRTESDGSKVRVAVKSGEVI